MGNGAKASESKMALLYEDVSEVLCKLHSTAEQDSFRKVLAACWLVVCLTVRSCRIWLRMI